LLREGKPMDKERAVEQAISQIERQFGRGSIMKMGEERVIDIPAISTGSLALDIALGIGGVPRGRVLEVFGPESSGKTTLALHIAAEAQTKGGMVVTPGSSGWMWIACWYPSLIPANRHLILGRSL
jgi:recombination protein RecA